jgi:hypothetical protein
MQKKFLKQVIKILGPCDIYERGKWMPISEDYINNNFDIDLDFGKVGEKYLEQVFEGDGRIEVKTERDIWATTGNIAIELRYKGRLSGLSDTDAKMWMQLLTIDGVFKGGFIIPVKKLKERIKELHESGVVRLVMGGDDKQSHLALLPINKVFKD